MPGTFEFAEKVITLSDLQVAPYNITANTYGAPVALAGGQTLDVEFQADTDELRVYGVIGALLRVTTGAALTLSEGGIDFSARAILTGWANSTSGTTPNQVRSSRIKAGGANQLPYFGVIGTGSTDDGGLMVVGLRCCKLDAIPKMTLDGQENKFNVSESSGMAIPVAISNVLDMGTVKGYETASGYTAPTDGATFLSFFATS